MARYQNSVPQILDGNGKPIVGAKKFFFNQGTTTKKTIYSDSDLTIAAANPVLSDADGRFPDTFLDGLYKEEQQDNSGTATGYDGVTLWTRDPVGEIAEGPFELWDSSITYEIPDIVKGSDDNYYRSLVDSNTGSDPVLALGNWEKLNLGRFWESGVTYAAGDTVYGSNGFSYVSRTSSNLGNNPTTDTTNWRPGVDVKLPKGADIASATALTLGDDGNFFDVTGTTAITSIVTKGVGTTIILQFDAALTLTHHATDLILPGNIDIVTKAGDIAVFYEYAAGDWICVNYARGDSPASGFRGCLAYRSTNQSIPNTTVTALEFNSEDYDTDSIHDTSTNNSRLTVPAGVTKVRLNGKVRFAANGTGLRTIAISKNGAISHVGYPLVVDTNPDVTEDWRGNIVSPVFNVVGGDYFELEVSQTSGAALNAIGVAGGSTSWFCMEIIG